MAFVRHQLEPTPLLYPAAGHDDAASVVKKDAVAQHACSERNYAFR